MRVIFRDPGSTIVACSVGTKPGNDIGSEVQLLGWTVNEAAAQILGLSVIKDSYVASYAWVQTFRHRDNVKVGQDCVG